MDEFMKNLGTVAGVLMPLFNIPLIMKICQKKSAKDISLVWAFGIWGCIMLMLPSVIITNDITLKAFGITNTVLFSAVLVVILKYHKQ